MIHRIAELRQLCQSTAPNPARESVVGLFSRRFSIYGTWLFLHTPLTPNMITAISVLTFFSGIGCFFLGTLLFQWVGCGLIFLSIIFDGCDGEVARYRKRASLVGTNYTEPVSHDIQYGIAFPLFAMALISTGGPWYLLLLGTVASVTKLLYRFLEIRFWLLQHGFVTDQQKIESLKQVYMQKPAYQRAFYWFNKNIFSSTGVFITLVVFVAIGRVEWYLWWYAIGYTGLWLLLFAKQVFLISTKRVS